MEIKDLFSYIGFLIVKLGPLFMVFYFILDSIFQANTKGIMYIIGICITVILTIIIGNTISFKNPDTPINDFCFPIAIENFVNISNLPLSQSIYGFTFLYIFIPLLKYQFMYHNAVFFVLFFLLILTDFTLLMNYNCFSIQQAVFSLLIGGIIGTIYISMLLKSKTKNIIYIPGIPQSQMCDLPKRKAYKCKLKTK